MAQRRMIHKAISTSKKLSKVSAKAALLYTWMIPFLDDFGCYHADTYILKRFVVPYRDDFSPRVIEKCLQELECEGLINLYEVEGYKYLELLQFDRFQTLKNDRKMTAEVPPPPQGYSNWNPNGFQMDSKWKNQDKYKEEDKEEGEGKNYTPLESKRIPTRQEEDHLPPSLKQQNKTGLGYSPTDESREKAWEAIREIESFLGAPPFTASQVGDGRKERMVEELSAVCRLLSPAEVVEVVRREYDSRVQESKGTDRPTNLAYYMPAIKHAFIERDRALEEAERRRDEEKRAAKRDAHEEPVPLGEILGKELTEEERGKVLDRIRQVRERIRGP